jgi:transketolase
MSDHDFSAAKPHNIKFSPRRGLFFDAKKAINSAKVKLPASERKLFEGLDLAYRTLCGILYNFGPTTGHPGGSISSGRIVQGIVYRAAAYDIARPESDANDMVVYAAGHKALGLYAMYALRDELVRIGNAALLPAAPKSRMRLEDLLGFRRNPTNTTPLFREFRARPLDGHPTPATPFVKVATGASGVGVPAAFGLALGALEKFGDNAPKVHIVEGEGGMTPGRVHEAMAAAATAQIHNIVMHLDFNQASIDSNRVCRDGDTPGEYVQWNPAELGYLHDWNVIWVSDGKDFAQVLGAQALAASLDNRMPTLIVYRTIKGWRYGMEGRQSHGAGHKFCSDGYYTHCAKEFEDRFRRSFPRFCVEPTVENIEKEYWNTLLTLRQTLEKEKKIAAFAAGCVADAKSRVEAAKRAGRADAPRLEVLYSGEVDANKAPEALALKPGQTTTLRGALGDALHAINVRTGGAIITAAADLLGSTSVSNISKGFPEGFLNAVTNPKARTITMGGICEDAMGAFMAGLAAFGQNIGVSSSYGAFISAMEHTAARLHGIGMQARREAFGNPFGTWIMVNAHAGLKTGEDGPTHADPQALQLLQGNFPKGVVITLTPWDPEEVWPLVVAGLKARPAVLAPFVTRPNEKVVDRAKLGLPNPAETQKGVYLLKKGDPTKKPYHGTIVLQESGTTYTFVEQVLPKVIAAGFNMNIAYVSSAELFDLLPEAERKVIYPQEMAREAMGITGFTLPTLHRFVWSEAGLARTLHPFAKGHYLGSGPAEKVLEEAGLDGESQWRAVEAYAQEMETRQR